MDNISKNKSRISKIFKKLICIFLCLSLILGVYTAIENFTLDIDFYDIADDKIPESFEGYKIAQISDFHNRESKIISDAIINSLKEEKPDVIFLTGDFVDGNKTIPEISYAFLKRLVKIAKCYYVLGNHECNFSIFYQKEFDKMLSDYRALGVEILRQDCTKLVSSEKESINLYGIDDPYFHCANPLDIADATTGLCDELEIKDGYNILLAHHPEQLETYSKYGFDLVFSGHAHGGQITFFGLPLVVPDQDFYPDYIDGLYYSGDTTLVLSRGIGYSTIKARFFAQPNLIYVTLKTK